MSTIRHFIAVWEGVFQRVDGKFEVIVVDVKGTLVGIRQALESFIEKRTGRKFIAGSFKELTEDENAKQRKS